MQLFRNVWGKKEESFAVDVIFNQAAGKSGESQAPPAPLGLVYICVPLPVAHGSNASSRIKLCQWAEKSGWPRFDDTEAH